MSVTGQKGTKAVNILIPQAKVNQKELDKTPT